MCVCHVQFARATSVESTNMARSVSPIGAEFRPTSKMRCHRSPDEMPCKMM